MSLVGKWNLESSENLDEYMKEMGVGFVARKAAGSVKPTITITNDGNKWTIKTESTLKTKLIEFEENKEFPEKMPDGRDTLSIFSVRDKTYMIQEQRDPKTRHLQTTIIREIKEDKMIQTMTCGNVVCTRTFKRTA